MDELKIGHAPTTFSRRRLLQAGGTLAGSIGVGSAIGYAGVRTFDHLSHHHENSEEDEALNNILQYRKSLGYSGLPQHLQSEYRESHDTPQAFNNELPSEMKSLGEALATVASDVLGRDAPRFIRTIKVGETSPRGIYFQPGDERSCNIGIYYADKPNSSGFLNVVLHEAIGHGTDPELCRGEYRQEDFIKAEEARWKMVAQAFSVPDEFFNHPSDLMYPFLKRETGAAYAWILRTNDIDNNVHQGKEVLQEVLTQVAESCGKTPATLKFNKRVVQELGKHLIPKIRRGTITLAGGLQAKYESSLDAALYEMYAEMIRLAIRSPRKIGDNEAILSGSTEILSAINNHPVDLQQIREKLAEDKKHFPEDSDSSASIPDSEESTNTPEIDSSHQQSSSEITSLEDDLSLFSTGVLPDDCETSRDDEEVLNPFADAYSRVTNRYPQLKETFASYLDESFDPDLDIWDIKKIEDAANTTFIRNLLSSLRRGETKIDQEDIRERTLTLLDFIHSPAF